MNARGHEQAARTGHGRLPERAGRRALIIDEAQGRGSLAAVRALRAAGWTVGVGSARRGLGASSRDCSRWHHVPALSGGLEPFLDAVVEAVRAGSYEVAFGAGDAEVLALSLGREVLPAHVAHPAHDTTRRALDKVALAQAAAGTGLATPASYEVSEETLAGFSGPMVMKARVHAEPELHGRPTRIDTRVVRTRAEAEARAAQIRAMGGEPLMQEQLAGDLIEFIVLVDRDAQIVAQTQQVAERLWPPEAGISTRARTVAVDRVIARSAEALVTELGWTGLAQLQLLVTPDGTPNLIDLNGRFYGSLALAVAAGVNLPAMWASLATGRTTRYGLQARPGVRYQWLEGDVRSVLLARNSRYVRELLGCLRIAPSAVHSIWSWRDPLPAVRYGGALLARAFRKRLRWRSRS